MLLSCICARVDGIFRSLVHMALQLWLCSHFTTLSGERARTYFCLAKPCRRQGKPFIASTTFMTGAQRPLFSANRDADRKALETSKAMRALLIDAYSRACTTSSVGREMIVHGAAVGLSPFDVRVTLHPLMVLSCAMESMWAEADFVAELPFFAYFALRG